VREAKKNKKAKKFPGTNGGQPFEKRDGYCRKRNPQKAKNLHQQTPKRFEKVPAVPQKQKRVTLKDN